MLEECLIAKNGDRSVAQTPRTIRSLPLSLPPGDRETPVDYLSRLSFRNGRDGLHRICTDFGIDLTLLIRGDAGEIESVARLGGADPSRLRVAAFLPLGDTQKTFYRGHVFHRSMTAVRRIRFCPACLREDVEGRSGRVECRPWRRGEWLIRDVATCVRHSLELLQLEARLLDFTGIMATVVPRLPDLVRSVDARPPTGLERYVVDRLSGTSSRAEGEAWLEDLPMYAVIRLCEVAGTVAVEGIGARVRRPRDATTRLRQAAGFEIVGNGPAAFRLFLDTLQRGTAVSHARGGPLAVFGRLYRWLANFPRDPSYDAVRQVIQQYWVDTNAVGPEDANVPFGWPVTERKLHSVQSASQRFGIHAVPLRKILFASGIVGHDKRDLTDDAVTFDATAHESFLRDLSSPLTRKSAAAHLGMCIPVFQSLLDAGLIVPWIGDQEALIKRRFRRVDLDGFVASLLAKADDHSTDDPCLSDIPTVARRMVRPQAAVVGLLLSGKLGRVGRRSGANGYKSVLVDPGEVLERLAPSGDVGMRMSDAGAKSGINPHVLRLLAREGLIRSHPGRNPVNQIDRMLLDSDDFSRFLEEYAPLSVLASKRGVSFRMLKNHLTKAGVEPEHFSDAVGAVFYATKILPDLRRLECSSRPGIKLGRHPGRAGG